MKHTDTRWQLFQAEMAPPCPLGFFPKDTGHKSICSFTELPLSSEPEHGNVSERLREAKKTSIK